MSVAGPTSQGLLANIKEIGRRIKDHNVTVSAAGIAFYGLLALVPTLLALVSVYGLVADPAEVESQVADLSESLDEDTQKFLVNTLQDIIGDADSNGSGNSGTIGRWVTLIISIAVALFSASGAVHKLMGTISVAYETRENRPGWKVRAMAYLFTAAAIIGMALMIFTIAVVPVLLAAVDLGGAAETTIAVVQLPALGILFGAALTVLYRYSPDRDQPTPWLNRGALVATLLFVLFSVAFSIYSANVEQMPASYGLLGSIAALMIFLQLTAIAVIIGAEVNAATETRSRAAAMSPSGQHSTTGAAGPSAADGSAAATERQPSSVSFGKALAGLIALFALSRGLGD